MYDFGMYGRGSGAFMAWGPMFALFALWSLFWKGLALWHSARRGETWWFLALLLLNTAGVVEIIYLFAIAKMKFDELIPGMKGKMKMPPAPPRA